MAAAAYAPGDQAARDDWDVVIIGTGMGGSTLGYELARRGRRVLFVEKGRLLHDGPDPLGAVPAWAYGNPDARLRTGRWPFPLEGKTSFGPIEFFAPWGCGSGGSTSIYGAQLERFHQSDFTPGMHAGGIRGANTVERWPITLDELVPHYRRAEELYRVRGTPDPLNPDPQATLGDPPPLSERDEVFQETFQQLGLHPYRSHVGFDYRDGCRECLDFCPKGCKSDAASVCLMPAVRQYGASVLPECEAVEVLANGSRVRAVRARYRGREIVIHGKVIVLAAGAFMTPILLLNSRSAHWPDGLANRSGQVGRNLMLHTSDFIAVDPRKWHSPQGPLRTLALNDFYLDGDTKLGALQSLGVPLEFEGSFVLTYLQFLEVKEPAWWRKLVRPLLPLAARIAAWALQRASVFVTILEDLPYLENRVFPEPRARNGMRFEYRYSRELAARNRRLCRAVVKSLSPRHRATVITGGRNNLNYGHVCGTCRFGDDPGRSVLDASNRAHDLENLYVVDASFFPSSGGTNPSLTVAANALRVGAIIDQRLS